MNLLPRNKLLFCGLSLFFVLLAITYWFWLRPPSQTYFPKTLLVKKGLPLRAISSLLEQEGIIRNRTLFIAMADLTGKKNKIKSGEYEFLSPSHPWKVLDILVDGQVKRSLVTIFEGYTLTQIAHLLEELGILEKKAFLQRATSAAFISTLDLPHSPGNTLEGYLFPDTYHLTKEMDPEKVIQMMTQQFKKIFTPELAHGAYPLGISPREAVILASIIEKETSLREEKPVVSAVFHNRLKKRIPLQSDPTVIYGIINFDGNLKRQDLLRRTPYNTYLLQGLPPTPICNPGKDSLLAALSPAPVPYLYFVSKNDGSHHFSSTMEEHGRAVWQYQKSRLRKVTK
jgi:UPF0755 protein